MVHRGFLGLAGTIYSLSHQHDDVAPELDHRPLSANTISCRQFDPLRDEICQAWLYDSSYFYVLALMGPYPTLAKPYSLLAKRKMG